MALPKVGDTLWLHFTLDRRDDLREYTVTKMGHKWIQVGVASNPNLYRVAISDFHIDGGEYCSPGTAYASKEDYTAAITKKAAWGVLQNHIRNTYHAPANVSLEDIQAAMTALKIQA